MLIGHLYDYAGELFILIPLKFKIEVSCYNSSLYILDTSLLSEMTLIWTQLQMPAVSARGRLKQEDHEFEVTLGYSLSIADNTLHFYVP